jgi:1,4-alpha-glucan branching enzyme
VVQLRVFSPDATSVHVSGDFNRWSAKSHSLTPAGDGWWNIDLDLSPGIYQYRFLVDGVWIPPTDAEITIDDGFGGKNAILEIPETPL